MYDPRAAVCMFLNSLTQTGSPIAGGDVYSAPKISVHFPVQPPLQENNRHVQDPWDFRTCFSLLTSSRRDVLLSG